MTTQQNYFSIKDDIVSVLEQRDQALTAPLIERIKVLEEALLPLAKVADAIGENMEGHFGIWSQTSNFKEDTRLLISDARKAREALQTTAEVEA